MPDPYIASSIPFNEFAALSQLMTEEIKDVAVFFMDTQGIITVWGRGAEEMKGYTAEDAIGSHLALLYTDEDRARDWPQHNLSQAVEHGTFKEEGWRKRKDGRLFWARITLTGLRDHQGHLVGFSKITVDLTEHKLLEQCKKEREETSRVLRAANAGTWTWQPENDHVVVSASFLGLLGYAPTETTMNFDQWLQFVEPADQPDVKEKFEIARAGCPGTPLVMEARMCRKNGSCPWFSIRADWYREQESDPYVLSGVNVDIQDLKTAEAGLRQAIDRLKETDLRKDEFLAMLAHELRNPLAPIRAAAELLTLSTLDEQRIRKTSEIIGRQVDHMTSLVDDLLDVSRVTRGLVELEKAPQNLRHAITDAVEQVSPLIQSRRQHLQLHLAPGKTVVMGDAKRLVQIIANLLNNAAKYTQEGGNILIATEVLEREVVLSVIDDGIGMDPELAPRVFDLFAQAERTPDRASGGLGLGLALVKNLVELHGGTVNSYSEGKSKGSTFTIFLPLLQDQKDHLEPDRTGKGEHASNKALRVMVVDDNADAAQMLAMLLEVSGHQVFVEHDARRALERSRIEAPDVCILDIGLPEIDGNELAQRLKAQRETADAVLIAVTGYGRDHDRDAAYAAGFKHHLVKPVDAAKLIALLDEISV